MSHNVGRIVTLTGTRIGPDTGTPPTSPGVWELAFTPQPALTGGAPRFVLLHLTAMSLPGTSRVEVELGYSQDVFTATSGTDVWTRPVDPALVLSSFGTSVPEPPAESRSWNTAAVSRGRPFGLRTANGNDRSYLNSVTNTDLFLHTDPYADRRINPGCNAGACSTGKTRPVLRAARCERRPPAPSA